MMNTFTSIDMANSSFIIKQTADEKRKKNIIVYIPPLREHNIHICILARNTNW